MKIGELAKQTGTTVETIRYYEKEGLLPEPQRNANGYRSYGTAHLERLRLIRNCRALDMAQSEIRTILAAVDQHAQNCAPINGIFDEHIRHVDMRIAELTHLKAQLETLRQRCQSSQTETGNCGILRGLHEMPVDSQPAHRTHMS